MAPKGIVGLGGQAAKEVAGRLKLVVEMMRAPTGCFVKGIILLGLFLIVSPIDLNPISKFDDAVIAWSIAYLIPEMFLPATMKDDLMIKAGLKKPPED